MVSRLIQCVLAMVPVTALLSIVGGPAPSAAHAECRARAAREQKAKRGAETIEGTGQDSPYDTQREGRQGSGRSEPASKPGRDGQNEPASMASFVAPEAAKPADGETSYICLASAAGEAHRFGPLRPWGKASNNQIICLQELHHPAYQAHAPPADGRLTIDD